MVTVDYLVSLCESYKFLRDGWKTHCFPGKPPSISLVISFINNQFRFDGDGEVCWTMACCSWDLFPPDVDTIILRRNTITCVVSGYLKEIIEGVESRGAGITLATHLDLLHDGMFAEFP